MLNEIFCTYFWMPSIFESLHDTVYRKSEFTYFKNHPTNDLSRNFKEYIFEFNFTHLIRLITQKFQFDLKISSKKFNELHCEYIEIEDF